MPTTPHNPRCFANHIGLWLCEPQWLREAVSHIQSGAWRAFAGEMEDSPADPQLVGDGVALISLAGPMMKGRSKYGGTSTVETRRQLRLAANDEAVKSVLLHVYSPGGHVDGTADLADDVRAVNKVKPVHAHIEDLGASAALWVATQARKITANRTADIGSMGVIGSLVDESKRLEAAGIKVHIISTGWQKAIGYDPEVTEEALEVAKARVGEIFGEFRADVRRGRGDRLPASSLETLSDGRMVSAREARRLGLIDGIASLDAAVAAMGGNRRRQRAAAARTRTLRGRDA